MNKNRIESDEINVDLYFSVWCRYTEYVQANPWKIQQIVAQDMRTAAKLFVQDYDKKADMFFAKNCSVLNDIIIYVQDWRGRIAKFELTIENRPVYIARRIT